jgi:hypothetical protein
MPYWFNTGLSQSMYVLFIHVDRGALTGLIQGVDPSCAIHLVLSRRKPKGRVAELPCSNCDGRRSAVLLILLIYLPFLEQSECHQFGVRRSDLNQPYRPILHQHDS